MKTMLSGVGTMVRYDTILVTKRDTIYLPSDKIPRTTTIPTKQYERRLTSEDETRLGKFADNVSKEEKEEIENAETKFRQRIK